VPVPLLRLQAARLYGLRTRLKVLRKEGAADRSLLRWYPTWQLLDAHAVLDLTSPWEQAWTTRCLATDERVAGEVVELGTWLGASSRAIARGLSARPGPTRRFHAYDTFTFDDIEARAARTPLAGLHHDGDSFRALYERRLGRHAGLVDVHEGDILDATWDGRPVGLLYVDLAKTWEIWRHVRATFLPNLEVGGVVVQQDWAHANTPWLHLWHHRWRDHFEPLGHVIYSGTVAFRLVRPLPPEAFAPDVLADHDPAEVRDAFAWSAALVHANRRANIAGAHVMLHALHGDLGDAVEALALEASRGPVVEELAEVAIPELARRLTARP
jgi:hypothetical protein